LGEKWGTIPNPEVKERVVRIAQFREKELFRLSWTVVLQGIKYIKEYSNIPFRCILAGDGPGKPNLLQFIEDNALERYVDLAGTMKQEKLGQYYLFADVFASRPVVLLEAMAVRCPVIAVRSSGIEDVIQNGYNGFKTEPDIAVWAQRIITLMKNPQVLHEMSENAFLFSRKFSEESIAVRVAKLYIKILRELKEINNACPPAKVFTVKAPGLDEED